MFLKLPLACRTVTTPQSASAGTASPTSALSVFSGSSDELRAALASDRNLNRCSARSASALAARSRL
jgi:hypothetical protein